MTQDEIIEMAIQGHTSTRDAIQWAINQERMACLALHDHDDVLAPIGASAWGEAYQDGWGEGTAAYWKAIKARGQS